MTGVSLGAGAAGGRAAATSAAQPKHPQAHLQQALGAGGAGVPHIHHICLHCVVGGWVGGW